VGFNGYPHGILNNSVEYFNNDYSNQGTLGLVLLDSNQLDVQNPLLLRGVE